MKNFLIALVIALCIFTAFSILKNASERAEPQTSSISTSLEDRCDFVVKSNGGDFHISEPNAGTYKYELYATPDGYVEVWKCN